MNFAVSKMLEQIQFCVLLEQVTLATQSLSLLICKWETIMLFHRIVTSKRSEAQMKQVAHNLA